jgi:predicted nucleotide-binding protein (sugar kinase/HSP70/actin superfamily)
MPELQNKPAKLSPGKDHIIDSDGYKVEYNDPRVVHVLTIDFSSYAKRMIKKIYAKYGRKIRITEDTSTELLYLARQLCSGRECIPMASNVGAVVKDIRQFRKKDEVTLYLPGDEPGPCQHGAWPVLWETFAERLNVKNAIFGLWPNPSNGNLGMGGDYLLEIVKGLVLGDLFTEAANTLRCLARDKIAAMEIFDAGFEKCSECIKEDEKTLKQSLAKWAKEMTEIPLTAPVNETPKVLIFGGLNVHFVHYPVTEYFIEQDIIPKIVDMLEGILWFRSQSSMRYGFQKGIINPEKQFSMPRLVLSRIFARREEKTNAVSALMSRIAMFLMEKRIKKYRYIMKKSGLLFDVHIPFTKIAEAGHLYATYNAFTETPVTTGRYLYAVKSGLYDGLVNLASFNCPPAMNSQATIRPFANLDDMPYADIDCEGPWISANQKRLLETVAVQAKRVRENKNKGRRNEVRLT